MVPMHIGDPLSNRLYGALWGLERTNGGGVGPDAADPLFVRYRAFMLVRRYV